MDSHPPHRKVKPPNVAPANPLDPRNRPAEGAETPEEIKMYAKTPKGQINVLDPAKHKQAEVGHTEKRDREKSIGSEASDYLKDNSKLMKKYDELEQGGSYLSSLVSDDGSHELSKEGTEDKEESNSASGVPKLPLEKDWLKDLDSKIKMRLNEQPAGGLGLKKKLGELKAWKPVKLNGKFDIGKEFNKNFKALEGQRDVVGKKAMALKPDEAPSSTQEKENKNSKSDAKKEKPEPKKKEKEQAQDENSEKKKEEKMESSTSPKVEDSSDNDSEKEEQKRKEAQKVMMAETTGESTKDGSKQKQIVSETSRESTSESPKNGLDQTLKPTTKQTSVETTTESTVAPSKQNVDKLTGKVEQAGTFEPTEKSEETTKAPEKKKAETSEVPKKPQDKEPKQNIGSTTKGVEDTSRAPKTTRKASRAPIILPDHTSEQKRTTTTTTKKAVETLPCSMWCAKNHAGGHPWNVVCKGRACRGCKECVELDSAKGEQKESTKSPKAADSTSEAEPKAATTKKIGAETTTGAPKQSKPGETSESTAPAKATETTTENSAKGEQKESTKSPKAAESTSEAESKEATTKKIAAETTTGAPKQSKPAETTEEARAPKEKEKDAAPAKATETTTEKVKAQTTTERKATTKAPQQKQKGAAPAKAPETTTEKPKSTASSRGSRTTEFPKKETERPAETTTEAKKTPKTQEASKESENEKQETKEDFKKGDSKKDYVKKDLESKEVPEPKSHLTTTPTTTTKQFLTPEAKQEDENLKKTATSVELSCEGEFADVVGSKKKEFLQQCSEFFAPSKCTDAWAGSVVIAVEAKSPEMLQNSIQKASKEGIKLKDFPKLKVDRITYTAALETTAEVAKPTQGSPIVPTNKYTIRVIGHPTTTIDAQTTTTTKDIESQNVSTMPPLDVVSSKDGPAKLRKFSELPNDFDRQADLQMQWQGISCATGDEVMCKTCVAEHLITAKNQCDSCNVGYALINGKCMQIPCETGIESRCKACAPQNERKYHHFCSECNDGYYLVDGSCVVAEVTLTSENMKKWDQEVFSGTPEVVNYTVNDVVKQIGQLDTPEKIAENVGSSSWVPVSKNVNSKLINGPQIRKIEDWIGIQDQTWELCYRKSGHGGNSFTFHKLCGRKGPTITIIKLHSGKLIGMYTSLSWGPLSHSYNMTGMYRLDESSFLFSLSNDFKHNRAHEKQYSIFDYHYFGPTFGGGHDIRVGFNMSSVSCRLGYSYECRNGDPLTKQCSEDFCGGSTVRIADIEVHFLSGSRTLSSLLISEVSRKRLEHWAEGDRMEWHLCYQKSRDEGDRRTFLEKCGGRGATYTVVQLDTGRLIGGFTRQSWGGQCYQQDSAAFLFRLPTAERPTAYKHEPIRDKWQICGGSRAPRFGGGPDLIIDSKLRGGYCNLGHTYACAGDLEYGQQECHENFCGAFKGWKILEMEVWTVHGPLSSESKYLTSNMVAKLNEWIGIPQMYMRKCFRKSDGKLNEISKCKSVNGPSVTLFLLSDTRIIGAYSSITPRKGTGFRFDSSAFLFSLHSDTYFNVTGIDWKYIQVGASHYDSSKAVLDSPKRSYAFGGGDFSLNSDLTNGVCNLGYTYKCRVGSYPSDACLQDFCGQFNVTVVDVEQLKIQCKPGFVLSGTSCQPYTCQISKEDGCRSCAALNDRRHNNHCASCNPGYALAYGTCIKYTCETSSKGSACLTCVGPDDRKQNDHCATCNKGYLIQGYSCQAHMCEVWPDSPSCRTCIPLQERWKSNQCASCWPGYHLNSMKCVPYTCDTTEQMDSCASCVSQNERSKDNHCATCNPGFGVKDGDCIPLDCLTGTGDSCAECVPQANRTMDNQCAKCNPGRFLTEGTCKLYDCTTGPHDACKSCLAPSKRTTDGECTACNEGYILADDKTCIPLPCETGKSGTSCQSCADPENRKVENQCATCHPGYYLKEATRECAPYICDPDRAHCTKCLDQAKRTAKDQCEADSCQKGYVFEQKQKICKALSCVTTSLVGSGCKICAAENERKHVNHCDGCHDGFDLWEGWCVVYCDPKDNKWDCCSKENPCGPDSGDCDKDSDCAGDLVCAEDVGQEFDAYQSMDVCMEKNSTNDDVHQRRGRFHRGRGERGETEIGHNMNANDLDTLHQTTRLRWIFAIFAFVVGSVLIWFCRFRKNTVQPERQWLLEQT